MPEDQQLQDTGAAAPVAGEQPTTEQTTATQDTAIQTDTGVNEPVVAAQVRDEKDFGPALKAELARRETQIQKKYEDQIKQAEQHQKSLDSIAEFYGYDSHAEYMQALEEAKVQRQIEAEAKRMGVDPSVIQEYVQPLKHKTTELEQKLQKYEHAEIQRMIDAEEATIRRDDPGYDKIKDSVHDLAQRRGLKVSEAYILLTHQQKVEQAKLQAEQEAITKLKQNADSSTGALGADAPEQATGYMNMSAAERRAFRERVKRGEAVI